ncbi:MAG: hypothetical protein AB8B49_03205 [Nitratireductor sp.]
MKQIEGELRLIDPVCYAGHLVFGNMPEVHEQIDEILVRNFKDFSVSFACTGEVKSSWDHSPIIGLDFEYSYNHIFAFFRFVISNGASKVELHHISFESCDETPEQNSANLAASLKEAYKH